MDWIEKYDNFMRSYLNCNNEYSDISVDTCITKYIIHGKLLKTYLSVDKMNIIKNKKLKIDLRNLEPLKLNYFRR